MAALSGNPASGVYLGENIDSPIVIARTLQI